MITEVRSDVFVDYMTKRRLLLSGKQLLRRAKLLRFLAIAKRTFHASKGDESAKISAGAFLNRDDAYKAFTHSAGAAYGMEKPPERVRKFLTRRR